ncbi:YXWGXW repeat-containing protein [Paraburkholderia caballeronis]|uniref:YXWGXW repeat-containing protein n=1 Tax=Paraburkholderia caballeronis TaxID=416943 RepID=UPI001FB8FCB6|nr:YXWGXW repeat-containing protein [Paraburkholderia caballeronis]
MFNVLPVLLRLAPPIARRSRMPCLPSDVDLQQETGAMVMTRRNVLRALTLAAAALAVSPRLVFARNDGPPPRPGNQPRPGAVERSPRRPPPIRTPPRPPRPRGRRGTQYVWIEGRWHWNGHDFEWIPGAWVPARQGWRWRSGAWVRRGDTWQYSDGRWER